MQGKAKWQNQPPNAKRKMSTNKRTEDIIKDKFDSREFAFDESAWAEAETLIEAQEGAGKTKGILLWIFSANVLIGLIALFAWLWPVAEQAGNENTLAANNGAVTQTVSADVQTEVAATPVNNEESTAIASLNESTNTTTELEETTTIAKATQVNKQPLSPAKEKPVKPAVVQNSTEEPKADKRAGNLIVDDSGNSTKADDESVSSNESNTSDLESTADATDNDNSGIEITKEEGLSNNSGADEAAENQNTEEEEELALITDTNAEVEEDINNGTGTATVAVKEEAVRRKSTGNKSSSSGNKKFKFSIPKPQPPAKGGRNSWGVTAGLSVWDPYASTLVARSYNGIVGAVGGLTYERALTKRFWFGVNTIYWTRGALNFNHLINETYGTPGTPDYVNETTIITPSVMHTLNVPLYIKYDISRRHHAMIGVSGSYLMATTYESRRLRETISGVQDLGTRKITGQHPGFNKFDVMFMLGYEYSLTDRLSVMSRFNYGFYDMTKNDYKNITSYDKNIGLEFTLKYDFLRH